jgi:hypothetical protein
MEIFTILTLIKKGKKITSHVQHKRKSKADFVNWNKKQTEKLLDEKLPLFGKKLSITFGKVRIKSQN